jgi:hypothetical protein
MTLINGAQYRAIIRLGFFEQVASNTTVASKLSDAGFVRGGNRIWSRPRSYWRVGRLYTNCGATEPDY